ncbi:MAG TPA: hypothetical protein VF278_23670 [Pirellulales bacterium]
MVTAEQIDAYIADIPDIYREILTAFPNVEPNRQPRYGLAYQSLWADFQQRGLAYSLGELMAACEQLASHGLVTIKHGIVVHPTDRGELLISALTGKTAKSVPVPALPPPPG